MHRQSCSLGVRAPRDPCQIDAGSEALLTESALTVESIPREALFLAGKVFLGYRRARSTKRSLLPDFYFGAHPAVMRYPLLTRDVARYRSHFPGISLVFP
jgi:predicted nucleic acid-binding protein